MENKELENNKIYNRGFIIGFVVGFLIISLMLFIYFSFIKKDDKDNQNNEQKSDSSQIVDDSHDDEQPIIDNNTANQEKDLPKNDDNIVKEDLTLVADKIMDKIRKYHLYVIDEFENNTTYGNIPTQESLYTMFIHYREVEDMGEYIQYNLKEKISKSLVDQYFKDVFNVTLKSYPDYICLNDNEPLYRYNSTNKEYIYSNDDVHGHGDGHDAVDAEYINIEKVSNDTFEITLVKVRLEEGGYFIKYGDSYDRIADAINYIKTNKSSIKDVSKFKYTFKKMNNDYYLSEFKKMN